MYPTTRCDVIVIISGEGNTLALRCQSLCAAWHFGGIETRQIPYGVNVGSVPECFSRLRSEEAVHAATTLILQWSTRSIEPVPPSRTPSTDGCRLQRFSRHHPDTSRIPFRHTPSTLSNVIETMAPCHMVPQTDSWVCGIKENEKRETPCLRRAALIVSHVMGFPVCVPGCYTRAAASVLRISVLF